MVNFLTHEPPRASGALRIRPMAKEIAGQLRRTVQASHHARELQIEHFLLDDYHISAS
jgi:hypothetical protein